MGLLKVQAFDAGPAKSGISISQGLSRGKTFFRIGLTAAAQEEFFGRSLSVERDALALVLTDDRKHHHLMGIKVVPADDPNGIPLASSMRDSVNIKVATWRPSQGKHPAASLQVINSKVDGGSVSVKLPEWARPVPDPKSTSQ